MTRWALASLAVVVLATALVVAGARRLGRSGGRASVLLSVTAHWLGAWVLWSFAGGLALRYGVLETYSAPLFGLVVLVGGVWHYRREVDAGRGQGLVVFVGAQLGWLTLVLIQNGVLNPF